MFSYKAFLSELKNLLSDILDDPEDEGKPTFVESNIVKRCYQIVLNTAYTYSAEEEDLRVLDEEEYDPYDGTDFYDEGTIQPEGYISFEYMQEVVNYKKTHPTHTFKTLENRFRKLRNTTQLYRWTQYVEANETKYQKYKQVADKVIEKFEEARECMLPVRDADLIRWGTHAAKEFGLKMFVGSCRKRNCLNENSVQEFRNSANVTIKKYLPSLVLNTDQIGVVIELHRMRTLSYLGEKDTYLLIQRANAVTHSVTVMPTVNLEGKLVGKFLLCLNETANEFGPIVLSQIEELERIFPFVRIVCSTSGKLTKVLIGTWIKDCFQIVPDMINADKALLFLDSWAGQWNEEVWHKNWCCSTTLERVKIPEGTTGEVQPLDTGHNSYFKYILKRLNDFIFVEEIDCIIGRCYNLVKLICLAYNQMAAPCFNALIRKAWIKAGLLDDDGQNYFQNPRDICFRTSTKCELQNCLEVPIIRCAHCQLSLCYNHFIGTPHIHV